MERIIITEVDNTSNVETLSSYDVVYVPGFSNNGITPSFEGQASLFRNPTLCTSKYEFLRLFGNSGVDDCPKFSTDQPYPIATAGTETTTGNYGFPSYAIPGYIPSATPQVVANLNNFEMEGITVITEANASTIIANMEDNGIYTGGVLADKDWMPEDNIVYYHATIVDGLFVMSALEELEKEEDKDSPYKGMLIFTSNISPNEYGWKILSNGRYIYTTDTVIGFNSSGSTNTTVKNYYVDEVTPSIMFYGPSDTSLGDADPGYRYAMYLLSLGIPVYYEQMNADFVEIDLNDPIMADSNPSAQGWFVQVDNQYIKTADTVVQSDTTYYWGAPISIESMYDGLEARFGDSDATEDYSFDSMGDYAVKYITSGGYPTYEYGPLGEADAYGNVYGTSPLAEAMIRLASNRKDALALIDHTNNPNRTIYQADEYSVVRRVRDEFASLGTVVGSYGTLFTPWYNCTHKAITGGTTSNYNPQMPASLAYLSALAQQLRDYNPWLAVSGVSRGGVPYCGGLHTNYTLTNNVADSYQILPGDPETLGEASISINPITYIRNYGYCIWGNRTLRNNADGTQSTSFLNIRNLANDIKKTLYDASLSLLFEQNTDILWLAFKNKVEPLLERMVTNYILSAYSLTRYLVDPDSGQAVPAYKVLANIRIQPINSVEVFDLQLTLENSELEITETE